MDCKKETQEVRTLRLTEEEVRDAVERRIRASDNLAGGSLLDPTSDQVVVTLGVSTLGEGTAEARVTHKFPDTGNSV